MAQNNGLLVAAMVAVVAVVGLALMFNGNPSGAAVCSSNGGVLLESTGDYKGVARCVSTKTYSVANPSIQDLEQGAIEAYGQPWYSYEASQQRKANIQAWAPNNGETFQEEPVVYHPDWVPNNGETYQEEPVIYHPDWEPNTGYPTLAKDLQ